jgi:hypothetical protein
VCGVLFAEHEGAQPKETDVAAGKSSPGWPAVLIVLIVASAIASIAIATIHAYQHSKDVAAVLAVVVSPLAGVGAAAFGVKLSADAKAETHRVKTEASNIADKARRLIGGARPEVRDGSPSQDPLIEIEADLRRLAGG